MGIEKTLDRMPKKRRKLLLDLTAVGIIFTLLYGFWTAGNLYLSGKGYMGFFSIGNFLPLAVVLIFLWMARSILQGKSIKAPNIEQKQSQQPQRRPESKQQPRQNIPKKPHITAKKPKKSKGSIKCPECGTLVVGPSCPRCGWKR